MNFVNSVAATSARRAATCIFILVSFLVATSRISFGGTQTVTTTADGGAGSLRQAIVNAVSGDTIQFQFATTPATIFLTSGDLQINQSLTITGLGAAKLIVDGSGNPMKGRVLTIGSGVTVSISGLTVNSQCSALFGDNEQLLQRSRQTIETPNQNHIDFPFPQITQK